MIFHLPLQRYGCYYMTHRTFAEISESDDVVRFHFLIKENCATITKIQDYFLITIPKKIETV